MTAKIIIKDNERGLVSYDGKVEAWLKPGRHRWWFGSQRRTIEILNLDDGVVKATPELLRVMPQGEGTELQVLADQFAIVSRDGVPLSFLQPGRYILWQQRAKITATTYTADGLFLDVPKQIWHLIPTTYLEEVTVYPYQRYLLYVEGKLEQVLEEGRYAVNKFRRNVFTTVRNTCEKEKQIIGQEVMTSDKVSLRLNLIVKYSIVDVIKSMEAVTSYEDALYSEAQIVARGHIAGLTLDELLDGRNHLAMKMREELQPRAEAWGLSVVRIDIKDVVLPGDMKALLNRVIEAEKEAAANVIARREETAATRSLANTAKMLEKNPMLLRLKELESIKEIAGNIQHLTVVAGGDDLMGRLMLPSYTQSDNESAE